MTTPTKRKKPETAKREADRLHPGTKIRFDHKDRIVHRVERPRYSTALTVHFTDLGPTVTYLPHEIITVVVRGWE